MKTLNLKINGQPTNIGEVCVQIDGKPVKFKKNEFGNIAAKYQTDQDSVNIKIYNVLDVGGILWLIAQVFFFVISVFGLLDIHRRTRGWALLCDLDVNLQDNDQVTLQFNRPAVDGNAVNVQTNAAVTTNANQYQALPAVERTMKKLKWAKIGAAIVTIFLVGWGIAAGIGAWLG